MNINESGCRPYGLASALIVIGVSACYPDSIEFIDVHVRHDNTKIADMSLLCVSESSNGVFALITQLRLKQLLYAKYLVFFFQTRKE